MFSVTGFASVAGGGGSMIPLPPFTSPGLSLAKAMSANRSKTRNAEISISPFFIGALRAGRDPRQHGPNGPMFGPASARLRLILLGSSGWFVLPTQTDDATLL